MERIFGKPKKERGGLVPIMKGFAEIKQEFAEIKQKVAEIEQKLNATNGKVEGVLTSSLTKCPECQSYVVMKDFGEHYIKMHMHRFHESEFEEKAKKLILECIKEIPLNIFNQANIDDVAVAFKKYTMELKKCLIERNLIIKDVEVKVK
jgi:hypothetical protein